MAAAADGPSSGLEGARSRLSGAADTPAPPPGVLVAGHFRQGAEYRVRRRRGTRDWLLTYTVAGAGLYRQRDALPPGGAWRAAPGDLWLLAPGAEHDYGTDPREGSWEFWWVHFLPQVGWEEWLRWPQVGDGLYRLAVEDPATRQRVVGAWERMVADARGLGSLREALALNALEEVLLLAARERRSGEGPLGTAVDGRVRAALEHVAANLAAPHSLRTLAERVCLSPSRLAHLVKAQTGATLLEAITRMRLREAARLLEFTDRPVRAIAEDVGFSSPWYFSRRFTQRYGLSPRAYRARVRAAGNGAPSGAVPGAGGSGPERA
jgi:AraC family transcriptional regulator of arabinose operon